MLRSGLPTEPGVAPAASSRRASLRWSPASALTPSGAIFATIALQCAERFLATVPVEAAVEKTAASDLCTEGAPPPRGTQRRTRHRRVATMSSTSSFRVAAAAASLGSRRDEGASMSRSRGTTFGVGWAARPSPPHLHSTRAFSAIDPCCCCCARCILPCSAVRARTGPASSPSSSPPRRERVDGKWRECWGQIYRPRAQHPSVGRCAGTSWPEFKPHLLPLWIVEGRRGSTMVDERVDNVGRRTPSWAYRDFFKTYRNNDRFITLHVR